MKFLFDHRKEKSSEGRSPRVLELKKLSRLKQAKAVERVAKP